MGRTSTVTAILCLFTLAGCFPGYLSNKHAGQEGYYAPPITALNGEGQTMRLKDFKDKVILLSFWHGTCAPCRAMFPHEKALVKKYQDQPFVLLGVNADESPFELKRIQDKAKLTWPSFWDGPNGGIAQIWGVERFPTFFVIDRENIVRWRYEGVPPDGLIEKQIDEALKRPAPKENKSELF